VGNLKVLGGLAFISCANCSGSGASAIDEAAMVPGTSVFAPGGGFFQTTATNNLLTNLQQGLAQMTASRAYFVNVRNASGAELGLTAAPFITAGAGTAGTPAGGVFSIQGVSGGTGVPVSVASGAAVDGWDVTAGTKADVPCTLPASSTACSEVAIQKAIANGIVGPIATLTATAWNTNTYGNGSTSPLNTNLNGNAFVSQSPAAPILASMQTAAVANGNGNNLNVTGTAGAVLTVNCATCSGGTQVNFQISQDGTNFASINAIQLPGGGAPVTNTTTSGQRCRPTAPER